MTPQQRLDLIQFLASRCARADVPTLNTAQLYAAYAETTEGIATLTVPEFSRALLSMGPVYQRIGGITLWALRWTNEGEDGLTVDEITADERRRQKREQLDLMRGETFSAVCHLRAEGKHKLANESGKLYLAILQAEREEFPLPVGSNESADFATPEQDPLPTTFPGGPTAEA